MEIEPQQIKKYPKWMWVLVYIVFGFLFIIIIAAFFGSKLEQDLEKHTKLNVNSKGRYVDIKLETSKIIDSATIIRISEKHRLDYADDKKIVIWFYLPANLNTLSPYATVMYPDKDYVRAETKDQDENGNKFKYLRIYESNE